jgi:hypothetical protein
MRRAISQSEKLLYTSCPKNIGSDEKMMKILNIDKALLMLPFLGAVEMQVIMSPLSVGKSP